MITERQGIVVYMHTLKQVRQLRKYGHVMYVSKKLKYALLYCDRTDVDGVMTKLGNLHFVLRLDPSFRPDVRVEFEKSKDLAKEYDYQLEAKDGEEEESLVTVTPL
nr:DUF2129 domain-containing protein [Aureibacillus halotolerans]